MAGKYTLGKDERLKSRKAIEELFSNGQRMSSGLFRVIYKRAGIAELRVGVGVSKGLFKKAVDRNRIRRLLREAYRLNKNLLQEALQQQAAGLHLFISYAGKDVPEYKTVEEATKNILNKLLKRVNENISSNT